MTLAVNSHLFKRSFGRILFCNKVMNPNFEIKVEIQKKPDAKKADSKPS